MIKDTLFLYETILEPSCSYNKNDSLFSKNSIEMSKRALEPERRLDVVSVLVETQTEELAFMLREFPIEMIFRFHPWRLIRLMNLSKQFMTIVEKRAEVVPSFWYFICKHAFPDCVIMMSVLDNQAAYGLQNKLVKYFDQYALGRLFLEYQDDANETIGHVKRNLLFTLPRNSRWYKEGYDPYVSTLKGFSFKCLDRSFFESSLLNECLVDTKKARHVEKCFKMVYPCGIPPAQYCFTSQVELRRLTLAFISFISESEISNREKYTVNEINSEYCIIGDSFASTRHRWFLPFVPLHECERFIVETDPIRTLKQMGKGPIQRYDTIKGYEGKVEQSYREGGLYEGHVFTFAGLCKVMTSKVTLEEYPRFSFKSKKAFLEIYDEVFSFALLYGDIDDSTPVKYNDYKAGTLVDIPLDMTNRAMVKREDALKVHGKVDPLYWDTLLTNQVTTSPNFSNDEWKTVIMNQIDNVKAVNTQGSPEYENIQAVPSFLSCMHCKSDENDVQLHVEVSHDLNTFCSALCQENFHYPVY